MPVVNADWSDGRNMTADYLALKNSAGRAVRCALLLILKGNFPLGKSLASRDYRRRSGDFLHPPSEYTYRLKNYRQQRSYL